MTLKDMVPWRWGFFGLRHGWDEEDRPYESFLREMDTLHKEMDKHLFENFWKGSGNHTFMTKPCPLAPRRRSL